ncbi:stage III sporulation protein AG [Paenibacillus antri]|uniref:Stage III sporulation protein AG n=1 Tax=Paenibacillus antri TaxID=2582848 RepID=A0A5R9GHV8_9BACL|nr:stage III sporulation protein AG [Paenibacillus antri]TLS52994.1 stage III sporulation protein AG [Paenibacillus antri]
MAKWWKAFEERFGGGPGGASRTNTFRWLLIVAGVGGVFMILNSFLTVEDVQPPYDGGGIPETATNGAPPGGEVPAFGTGAAKDSKFAAYEASYEDELKEILQKIVGVGEVNVLVTIESTEEVVAERNVTESAQETNERDPNGANRHITQTSRTGEIVLYTESGDSVPLVRKTIRPTIRGVFVVAEGAENLTVKKMMIEAVERGLGVPSHKISVAPSKR